MEQYITLKNAQIYDGPSGRFQVTLEKGRGILLVEAEDVYDIQFSDDGQKYLHLFGENKVSEQYRYNITTNQNQAARPYLGSDVQQLWAKVFGDLVNIEVLKPYQLIANTKFGDGNVIFSQEKSSDTRLMLAMETEFMSDDSIRVDTQIFFKVNSK